MIREMKVCDIPIVINLIKNSYEKIDNLNQNEIFDKETIQANLLSFLSTDQAVFILYFINGELVCAGGIMIMPSIFSNYHKKAIEIMLNTDPSYSNFSQALGTKKVLVELINWSKEKGVNTFHIGAFKDSNMNKYFEKKNFVHTENMYVLKLKEVEQLCHQQH